MQGVLLIMCLCWLVRQHRLGIDDFGNPINPLPESESVQATRVPEDGAPVQVAVNDAIESDVRTEHANNAGEETPLLAKKADGRRTRIFTWFGGRGKR